MRKKKEERNKKGRRKKERKEGGEMEGRFKEVGNFFWEINY